MKNRLFAAILALVTVLVLLPAAALAGDVKLDISNGNIIISDTGYTQGSVSRTHTGSYTIVGVSSDNYVEVESGKHDMVLNGVDINCSASLSYHALSIASGAEVSLTLEGDNYLTGAIPFAGLYVPKGASVTITAASTGTLTACGGQSGAGIGGSKHVDGDHDCGNVTINGGTVTAKGGEYAAGIGGSSENGFSQPGGSGGEVTINGGTVTAIGGSGDVNSGAGIGGGGSGTGKGGSGGKVTINGGSVTASGRGNGAGIGGGGGETGGGNGGDVYINGGTVAASGNGDYYGGGAGIGGGGSPLSGGSGGSGGNVYIKGGSVKATGANGGENIGKGKNGSSSGTLTNGSGANVYLATLTLKDQTSETPIAKLNSSLGDAYGMTDVNTLADGGAQKLYLYLPESTKVDGVTTRETAAREFTNQSGTDIEIAANHLNTGTLTLYTPTTLTVSINGGTPIVANSLELAIAASGVPLADVTSIEITAGVVDAEDWVYIKDATSLATLTVGSEVTSAADLPTEFLKNSTIKTVDMAKVMNVGSSSFQGCEELTTASFPDAVSIYGKAFDGCSKLTAVSFPKAESINNSAFSDCFSLTKASFPEATSIGSYTFQNNTAMETASFPKVESIGVQAFDGCSELTELSLTKAPPTVDMYVFDFCPDARYLTLVDENGAALTGTELEGAIAAYESDVHYSGGKWYGWVLSQKVNITVKINGQTAIRAASLEKAIAASGVPLADVKSIEITAGDVTVEDWVYIKGATSLTTLKVDSEVTSAADLPIGFLESSSIKTVDMANVENVGGIAFSDCSSLTKASFPDAKSIEEYAFSDCSSLDEVSLPKATTIVKYAFNGCASLATASFPEATKIGDCTFYNCSKLATASFPKAENISDLAFSGCSSLAALSLPKAPPTVADSDVFEGCPAARYLTLVDENGATLTGQALSEAIAAYESHAGYSGGKWYGWVLAQKVNITVKINGKAALGAASLERAIAASGVPLADVASIEITGGDVKYGDWEYIKGATTLKTLKVSSDVNSAADLPSEFLMGSSIETVDMAKVDVISNMALNYCKALTTVNFPNATSIGYKAFQDCPALETASFPTVTSINSYAFEYCTALATVSFPKAPPTVENKNAFENCPSTRYLTLIDENGAALTGTELEGAIAAYKSDAGYADEKWYGWTLPLAPSISGDTEMELIEGYADTSTSMYTVNGSPKPTVTKTSGDDNITWNAGTHKLDIEAGLAAGSYPVTLKASNGVSSDATLNFTLTVVPAYTVNVVNGTGGGNYIEGATVKIEAASATGYNFKEWTTSDGVTFTDSTAATTTFKMPAKPVEVTATYEAISYDVAFNKNAQDATGDMQNQAFTYDVAQALTLNAFTRPNHVFAGWAMSETGAVAYRDRDSVSNLTATGGATVTIYAVWTKNSEIATVDITDVVPPVAGEAPNSAADCSAVGVVSPISASWSPQDAAFVSGKEYTVSVALTAAAGYEFAQTAALTATVNGSGATVSRASDTQITVTFKFPKAGTLTIKATPSGGFEEKNATDMVLTVGEGTPITPDHLKEVSVNGVPLARSNYSVERGSIVITLKKSYLNTLKPGVYTLRATMYSGAYAETEISVFAKPPKTGDSGNPIAWLALCLMGMAGAVVLVRKKRGA